jgi:hypothetical protein
LQLVIKDGLIAHEKYAELARKQQSRRNKADKAGAAGAAGGATMAGGGYANVVSGGSSQGSRDSSARGSGSASAANYQQQALGMFSTTQLKRKLAEALPFDVARGAPTPALSLSNPASREGSMHGSHHGDFRSRSCETSQHNFLEMGSQSGRRSRDGSSHDVHADYGMPEQQNPDDSGKRVRKDGETLSKTLSVAGQQAVELTMRYLAHMLLRGEGISCFFFVAKVFRTLSCPFPFSCFCVILALRTCTLIRMPACSSCQKARFNCTKLS